MSAFDDFRDAVLDDAKTLAKDIFGGNAKAARAVAAGFVDQSKEKLERWTRLLAHGDLTQDEFAELVRSQKDLADLNALTQAGIALEHAQQFREKLTDVVITKAFDILL